MTILNGSGNGAGMGEIGTQTSRPRTTGSGHRVEVRERTVGQSDSLYRVVPMESVRWKIGCSPGFRELLLAVGAFLEMDDIDIWLRRTHLPVM